VLTINTILHPTDFSSSAHNAFELVCSLASQHQAKLLLVHVISPSTAPPSPYNAATLRTVEEDMELAYERLEEMRTAKSQLDIEYVLAEGQPAEEILRIARETDADLIVMGMHGRTGLEHMVMGSVAEHVTREAPCRVLTIRQQMTTKRPAVNEPTTGVLRHR